MSHSSIGAVAFLTSLAVATTTTWASAQDPGEQGASSTSVSAAPAKKTKKRGAKKPKATPKVEAAEPAPPPAPEPKKEEPKKEEAKKDEAAPVTTTAAKLDAKSGSEKADADKPNDDDLLLAKEAAEKPISIAPLAGFASDGLRLGLGVRAGYTIASSSPKGGGVYLGGAFMYHLGYSNEMSFGGQSVGSSVSAFYPSVEAGYDIRIKRLVVRPYGGLGLLVMSVSTTGLSGQGLSGSANSLALYPGANISYDIPSTSIFVGGDARILIPFEGNGGVSFGAFGSAGIRF